MTAHIRHRAGSGRSRAVLVALSASLVLLAGVDTAWVPATAVADEIDLSGSWKLELDCGGNPTGVDYLAITENAATGALTATRTCDHQVVNGVLRPVASCGTVPPSASVPGQVTGAQFRWPDSGTVRFESVFSPPFSFICAALERSQSDTFLTATIGPDLAIAGTTQSTNVAFIDVSSSTCATVPGPVTCDVLMRRSDLPAVCTIDGIRSAYEDCDDNNANDGDGCDTTCVPTGCGSGVQTAGEECDDGDAVNGDGCDNNCTTSRCGNGELDPNVAVEECDDGNLLDGDGCDSSCQFEIRDLNGDWKVEVTCGADRSELFVHIDENLTNGAMDVTTTDCGAAIGPSGVQDIASCATIPPSASLGGQNSGNQVLIPATGSTRFDVVFATPFASPICSSGNVARNELNRALVGTVGTDLAITGTTQLSDLDVIDVNGGACFSVAALTCDLLMRRTDLPAGCTIDGIRSVDEACDDGNLVDGDGCDTTCRPTGCGSGAQTAGEECDDGNSVNGDGCDNNCTTSRCGNGALDPNPAIEECDDGNPTDFDGCSSTCRTEQLDLGGSWQVTADCGSQITVSSVAIVEPSAGTGDLEVSPACDGTTVWEGRIREWGSCTFTPNPVPARTVGSGVIIPASGTYSADIAVAAPWSSTFCGADPLARTVALVRIDGTVAATTGAGVATRVVGNQSILGVDFYDDDNDLCASLHPLNLNCPIVMLRNDLPVGTGVTVEPFEDATVTFETVTSGGTVTVTPLDDVTGQVPANYQVQDLPLFFDVEANGAGFSGGVTVCLPYPDVDQNGFVDGTTPAIAEADVRLLHREAGLFVDRTAAGSPDTVANVVCAETTSLSPFVFADDRAGPGEPLSGQVLAMRSGSDPAKANLTLVSKDPSFDLGAGNASADDPVSAGATVRIHAAGGAFDTTLALPAAGWSYIGKPGQNKGYKFVSKDGPVRRATLKGAVRPSFQLSGRGSELVPSLVSDPGPLTAVLTVGTKRSCVRFGGDVSFAPGRSLKAKNALAPASCDLP